MTVVSGCSPWSLRSQPSLFLGFRTLTFIVTALCGATAFARSPQAPGWAGPWDWSQQVPSCAPTEFAHAALVPIGVLKGKVLLWADLPPCVLQDGTQAYVFDPDDPATLGELPFDSEKNIFCSGMSWNWQGRLLITGGIRTPGTFPSETYLVNPLSVYVDTVYPVPPCGPCTPQSIFLIDAETFFVNVDNMSIKRFYPTLVPLNRQPIDTMVAFDGGGTVPTISGAGHLVLGGPPITNTPPSNDGNELWQVFDSETNQWSHTLRPEDGITSNHMAALALNEPLERYLEKPVSNQVDQLLDTYPRAFQLGEPDLISPPSTRGQILVVNDVDTDPNFGPTHIPPNTPGRSWVIKPPSATLPPGSGGWELWHGAPEPPDPGDCIGGNAPNCFKDRYYGTAVLMHTLQFKNRVLVFGGSQDPLDHPAVPASTWRVNNSVYEYQLGSPGLDPVVNGSWLLKTPLNERRVFLNAVILPTGNILIVGGDREDKHHDSAVGSLPVAQPELYDPGPSPASPGTSTLLQAPAGTATPRLYHSVAVLLPDASVFVASGAVLQPTTAPDSRHSGEIFYPPYFSAAQRPMITAAPGAVEFSFTFEIEATTYHQGVHRVVLLRPAALTHHCDMDQRYIELDFLPDPANPGTIFVLSPHESLGPPGYYMLFVVEQDANGDLIPSDGHFIRLKKR